MTQEEKELLLKDLSARLPYGVLCDMGLEYPLPLQRIFVDRLDGILLDFYEDGEDYQVYLTEVKPHLRPMSSMTEEEEIEYGATFATIKNTDGHYDSAMTYKSFDYLNSHHFDYRGLIDKGLAVKATEKDLKMIFKIISFLLS